MVLWYPLRPLRLRVRGFHPLWPAFPKPFHCLPWIASAGPNPAMLRTAVWALPVSLAATSGIDVSFSSSGYLDVSVPRVPLRALCIRARIHKVFLCGFPHSDTPGSMAVCASPGLFAAYRVFLRPPVPRHPPCALFCLALCGTHIALCLPLLWMSCRSPGSPAGAAALFLLSSISFLAFPYAVFKVQLALPFGWAIYKIRSPCFYLFRSGSHLLSHTVSSAVPSAARALTIVFGMGTGVSPGRIATGCFSCRLQPPRLFAPGRP